MAGMAGADVRQAWLLARIRPSAETCCSEAVQMICPGMVSSGFMVAGAAAQGLSGRCLVAAQSFGARRDRRWNDWKAAPTSARYRLTQAQVPWLGWLGFCPPWSRQAEVTRERRLRRLAEQLARDARPVRPLSQGYRPSAACPPPSSDLPGIGWLDLALPPPRK
jgi:hypothetical protein